MELFKAFYELGILGCVLAIFTAAQILAIYVELLVDRANHQQIRK